MDEPTAHLDFHHELRILETVVELVKEKKLTIIMATHFPNHAHFFQRSGIKTQVGMLSQGRFVSVGNPTDVVTREKMKKVFGIESEHILLQMDEGEQHHMIPIKTVGGKKR
jgi:iron complex transport system ATP-binding protein